MANDESDNDSAPAPAKSLIAQFKQRDPETWTVLVDYFGRMMAAWLARMDVPRMHVPDIVQNVWLAVVKHLDSVADGVPDAQFVAWLRKVTVNKAHDHFREFERRAETDARGGSSTLQRLAELPDPPPAEEPSDDALNLSAKPDEAALDREVLRRVRAEVEERTWRAFWRFTVDHVPAAQVAEELGMTVKAVYYKCNERVKKRLWTECAAMLAAVPEEQLRAFLRLRPRSERRAARALQR